MNIYKYDINVCFISGFAEVTGVIGMVIGAGNCTDLIISPTLFNTYNPCTIDLIVWEGMLFGVNAKEENVSIINNDALVCSTGTPLAETDV